VKIKGIEINLVPKPIVKNTTPTISIAAKI
jgi:hypothetical protein